MDFYVKIYHYSHVIVSRISPRVSAILEQNKPTLFGINLLELVIAWAISE